MAQSNTVNVSALTFSALAAFIMAYGMGVNFPQDRTGMYLVIYFIGSFSAILTVAKKWNSPLISDRDLRIKGIEEIRQILVLIFVDI